jgi:hypothetical protein
VTVIPGPVEPQHGRLGGAPVTNEIGRVLRDAEQLELGVVAIPPMGGGLACCRQAEDGVQRLFE